MTPRSKLVTALTASLILSGLAACNGDGDGSSTPGIRVIAQTTYMTTATPAGEPDAVTDPAQEESGFKSFYTADDTYIQLQAGLVNLRVVELVRCSSVVAKAANSLLDFVFPTAHAHAAHFPTAPAGVIDVLKPDLLVWDLGQQAARPGDYCGVRLEIAPVTDNGGHTEEQEEAFSMAGKGIVVGPCVYEDGPGSGHGCYETAWSGEAVDRVITFGENLHLGENKRGAHLMLVTHYDSWFDGLDLQLLETGEANQLAQLARNVLNSFSVYSLE